MKDKARGYTEEVVSSAYGCNISCVLWNDTKPVRLISTYAGVKPYYDTIDGRCKPIQVTRWDKIKKQHVKVECPLVISEYNKHMGGVDLLDGLIGRYHIRMKTGKWTVRLFHHLIDVAAVNAYILYSRVRVDDKIDLPTFRSKIAEALCFSAIGAVRRVGRPLKNPQEVPIPKKDTKSRMPIEDIRYDGFQHLCEFTDRVGRKICKLKGCKSETQSYCTKCKCHLLQNHLTIAPKLPKINFNYFYSNKFNVYVHFFQSLHHQHDSVHLHFVILNGELFNDIQVPFTDAHVVNYLTPFIRDPLLQRKFSVVCHDVPIERLPRKTVPLDDKEQPIFEIIPTEYTSERIDDMLLGTAELNKEEMQFLNSIQNNKANFLKQLLLRWLPIPCNDLVNVLAFRESPYNTMLTTNLHFRAAKSLFIRDIMNMTVCDYYHMLSNTEYLP